MISLIKKEDLPEHLPIIKGRNTLLRSMLLQLEIGEALFLPKEDWKAKNTPRYVVAAIKKKTGYTYEYGKKTDGTGWLFKRVE